MPGLLWDLVAKDQASPSFLRVAGAADKAATATERATRRISATSARLAKTGATLTKSLTLPIIAATGVAVDQAVKYQKALTLIQTAGGETAKKTAAISKGLMGLARTTGQSLDDLSTGIYTVAKAGAKKWSATQQLTVLKAAAQSATTEHVDLGTAVSALTSVMQGYGISAGKAVTAENQIIRASGLSKTSMQDFAGSLANVVPLASSLHISFAQIGGAIATMTQHGETADRATQNLSNLITNLAGQNNVASAAMQQLGLNTIKLQKNLSKNGLTGTLQMVEDKIAGSSKAGMVVVSAFKQAQNATHDLQIELSHTSGALATNSKAFVSGKEGYKDYLTFVKSLGGQQYQLGRGIISTVAAAKGFNTQLTSGNAAVRTQATELQKLLGGVTGMRTALMLGGTSAKQFANNTKEIGKAALHAGADVLGWNKTSDTLAVKMANAGHSLQVLAVEIGTALIPAVSKIVSWVQNAITWIGHLTDTQRKIAAWSVGILAALGPVLSLGARFIQLGRVIGSVTTGISRAITTLATGSTTEISGVTRAMQGLTSALAGAGIGYAIGTLTKNSSTATKAVGALGSAALGAAVGFGVGGPLGAGIGAIAGGLTSLATSFLGAGNSGQTAGDKAAAAAQRARAAIQKQRAAVSTLTGAIQADSDAIGANTKAQVSNDLQKSGALALASKLHIPLNEVTKAVLGHAGAEERLNKALGRINPVQTEAMLNSAHFRLLLRDEGVNLRDAALKADQLAAAQGKLNLSSRSASQEYARYGTALTKSSRAGQMNIKFIKAHVQALNDERKSGKLTDRQYADQLGALQKVMHQYKFNGDAVTAYVKRFAKLPKSVITKLLADPKNATWATKMVLAGMKLLPKEHNTDLKVTDRGSPLAQRLQARINAIKQGKIPSVSLNTAQGLSALQTLEDRLQALHNKNVTVYVHTQNSSSGRLSGARLNASGGYISGPGSGTSDSIPARLSNGEFVVNARQTSRHLELLHAINGGAQGFAVGGHVDKNHALFKGEGPKWYHRAFDYMRKYARPNHSGAWQYQTTLSPHLARAFERWVINKRVPFQTDAKIVDYDMRGFYKKTHGRGWHHGSHFPDTWKTPYDTTFSDESRYANGRNRLTWHGQRLINEATGQLVFGPARRAGHGGGYSFAGGGSVRGAGTGSSDSVLARLSNGEFVVRADQARRHSELLHAINTPGFASGGQITTKTVGGKKEWVYGGQEYASRMAAENARARAGKTNQSQLSSSVSSVIGGIGSAPGSKFNVNDIGINRVMGQIGHAWDVLNAKIAAGLSKHAASKYRQELERYTKLAQHQLISLRVHIRKHDLDTITNALGKTPADIRTAFTALFGDIQHAGGAGARVLAGLHRGEQQLIADQRQISQDRTRIANARQYRSGIRSTLAGQYDITQSGSVGDLINGLHGATGTNRAYKSELTTLRHRYRSDKAGLSLINKLAASGQTATLQSLANASRAQDLQAAKAYSGYQGSLTGASNAAVMVHLGKSVGDLVDELKHDRKHEHNMTQSLAHLVTLLAKQKIHLDGKEIGSITDQHVHRALQDLEQLIRHGQS